MSDLISLIVTTWNREDALDAVLRSLAAQSDRDFEVVIADDGSGEATASLIADWVPRLGRPLKHVWQEHRGFRAAEIRNHAIRVSQGSYCVFLDGDCVARPDFVAVHRALAEPGWFVTGNRILMSETLTAKVLRERLDPEHWSYREWVRERGRGGINRTVPLMRLPLGPLRKLRFRAWRGARSCNLGIWRSDLDRVDGFDCAYQGWGREDSDLLVRLLHAGVKRKDGVFATGVLHLWHPAADRAFLPDNDCKLDEVRSGRRATALHGLSTMGAAIEPLRVRA
ncbi:MAG: glycosyltransferase family 2 protein [Pseudorhodoplanes sp.]|uniref:glycosyltransferase family 2 protein n=1 Tax=Pseudorhodoplanes sp. TaxID=1934341 RepID=UPI003D0DCD8C